MSRAQQIEEQAALWVLQREEPSWSSTDQAEFDEWLAQSDAHKAAFWRLESGWREADRIASLGAPLRPVQRRFDELSWGKPLALAASLLLAFTFLLQWPGLFDGSPQRGQIQFATQIGGHTIVSLPDGSRVELNTDTAIRAAVDDRGRAVWLDRGELDKIIAKREKKRSGRRGEQANRARAKHHAELWLPALQPLLQQVKLVQGEQKELEVPPGTIQCGGSRKRV